MEQHKLQSATQNYKALHKLQSAAQTTKRCIKLQSATQSYKAQHKITKLCTKLQITTQNCKALNKTTKRSTNYKALHKTTKRCTKLQSATSSMEQHCLPSRFITDARTKSTYVAFAKFKHTLHVNNPSNNTNVKELGKISRKQFIQHI